MSNIAVFTVFRNTNYGAVLQAYALTHTLKKITGKDVYLIDYIRDQNTNLMHNGIVFYGKHGKKTVNQKSLKKLIKSLLNFEGTVRRTSNFKKFIKTELNVFPQKFYDGDSIKLDGFEYYFLGSDQIWNPTLLCGFHDAYFGITENKVKRVIAYAPSLGKITFSDDEEKELTKKLQNVDILSCREENGCEFLKNVTKKNVECVLDPTLLIKAEEWELLSDKMCKLPSKYVLVYTFKFDKDMIQKAIEKAKSIGGKVILLGNGAGKVEKDFLYMRAFGPKQFISTISKAEYVYTDSFHGTAFSILFNKQFVVMAHEEKGQRMENLCKLLDLESRVYRSVDVIPEIDDKIDYKKVNEKLASLRKHSLTFIKNSIL